MMNVKSTEEYRKDIVGGTLNLTQASVSREVGTMATALALHGPSKGTNLNSVHERKLSYSSVLVSAHLDCNDMQLDSANIAELAITSSS